MEQGVIAATTEPFWIVWRARGKRRPNVKHSTLASATAEAARLSALFPGAKFYVCEAIGFALEGEELRTERVAVDTGIVLAL